MLVAIRALSERTNESESDCSQNRLAASPVRYGVPTRGANSLCHPPSAVTTLALRRFALAHPPNGRADSLGCLNSCRTRIPSLVLSPPDLDTRICSVKKRAANVRTSRHPVRPAPIPHAPVRPAPVRYNRLVYARLRHVVGRGGRRFGW